MINWVLDEAYCLDFLSVLDVKLDKAAAESRADVQKRFDFYLNLFLEQVGDELGTQIMDSSDYSKLKDCNKVIFETLDNCKKYKVDALTIDKLNYNRFLIKNEIQKKYFGKAVNELKFGY